MHWPPLERLSPTPGKRGAGYSSSGACDGSMRPTYMVASIEATETRIGKARRYQRRAPDAPFSLGQLRERELFKAINRLFGASLPNDDCGREALRELLNQLALNGVGPDQLREFALDLVPELDDDDSIYNLVKEVGTGRKRRADTVARALGITGEKQNLQLLIWSSSTTTASS